MRVIILFCLLLVGCAHVPTCELKIEQVIPKQAGLSFIGNVPGKKLVIDDEEHAFWIWKTCE